MLTSWLYIILYLLNKDVFYDIAVVQTFYKKINKPLTLLHSLKVVKSI